MMLCPTKIDSQLPFFPHLFKVLCLSYAQKSPPLRKSVLRLLLHLQPPNRPCAFLKMKKKTIALRSSLSLGIFVLSQGNHASRLFKCIKQIHYRDVFPSVGLPSVLWPSGSSCCLSGSILQWLLGTPRIHCVTLLLSQLIMPLK